jgi:tetratricopeptide (TPR) repeat protein
VKRNLPLIVSVAVLALFLAGLAPSRVAAQGTPKSGSAVESYCALVQNPEARKLCFAAREQHNNHQFRAALATMRKAFAIAPKEPVIRALTAYMMIALGDEGTAERELRQARKDGAADHVVLSALLPLMISRHEETELLTDFPEPASGAKGEQAADVLFGRGKAFLSLGRLPEAAAAIDRSIALRRDASGLVLRAEIATRQDDKVLAAKLLDEAYRLEPKSGPVVLAKLKQIQDSGDSAKTLAFTREMLGVFPTAIELRIARIETYLKLKQDHQAKAEVDALLAKLPNSHFGRYYTALLMAHANNKNQAWQVMQAVPIQFVKQNPSVAIPMARLAVDTGHIDTGAVILGSALSAAPDTIEVRLQLASLRMAQNMPRAALSVLTPVKDLPNPRVRKLLANVQAKIAKDRTF